MLGRLNKIKSDFVSIVGHELRTPLTSIQGFSEIIRDEDLTREEVTEYAADINAEAQRLSRLIDDMLDLDTCSTSVDVQLDQEDRLASQVGGQRASTRTRPGHCPGRGPRGACSSVVRCHRGAPHTRRM